jgi:hypothetical protein
MILKSFRIQHSIFNIQKRIRVLVLLLIVHCSLIIAHCYSQGISINTIGNSADVSAILDVKSTSQGLLIPRMTTVQRDAINSPALSLLIFNTTTNCFEAYVNGVWYSLSCAPPTVCSQMQKVFGFANKDWPRSTQQTIDGGYIMAGTTIVQGALDFHAYLLKTDGSGNLLWSKIYYEGRELTSVKQTIDGGYVTAGYTLSVGAGTQDFYLLKTDESGNPLWSKTYGGAGKENAYSVEQNRDGSYIILGATETFGVGGSDLYLIKTDVSGNIEWSKTYGGAVYDEGNCVNQTSDGGYIIGGGSTSFGAGGYDFYLLKTDGNGNLSWSKTFGGSGIDDAQSVHQTSDGGYIMTGETESFGAGNYDFYLVRTDGSGNLLWNKTYGGTGIEQAYSGKQTGDGGYFMAGNTNSYGAGAGDFYLIKTDGNGNLSWSKTYGGTDWEVVFSAQQTKDGGYVIGGASYSFGAGEYDFYLAKTDENGNAGGCNTNISTTTVTTPMPTVSNPATVVTSPATIVTNAATTVTILTPTVTTPCSLCK